MSGVAVCKGPGRDAVVTPEGTCVIYIFLPCIQHTPDPGKSHFRLTVFVQRMALILI